MSAAGQMQLAAVGGSTWTPAALAPAAWWDADDAATFTYSSGVVVSQWRDKSGNAQHLVQGTTGNQPSRNGTVNGRSSVVFNGTSTSLTSPVLSRTKPHTVLMVARNTAPSGQRDAMMAGADGRIFRTSTGTIDIYQGSFLSSGSSWGTTAAHAIASVFNGVSSKIAVDSGAWINGDAGVADFASSEWVVGTGAGGAAGSEYWQGDICEVVCTNALISDADRVSWMDYAKTKWGTP